MTDLAVFGPSIDSSDVEAAMLAFLPKWMPTYVERQRRRKDPEAKRWALDAIEPPRSYRVTHLATEKWPEDQLPCIIVRSPGMIADPDVNGDGSVDGTFGLTLFAIAEGIDEEDSKLLSRLYGRAAAEAIMQHPDLASDAFPDGFASHTGMGAEENAPLTRGVEAERSLAVVSIRFAVVVQAMMSVWGGPAEPLPDPTKEPADPHVGKTTHIAVDQGADKVALLRDGGSFFEE
jgi:hypothetical protein